MDLAVRAARALQAASGSRYGVDIALAKRIPLGSGLGGGSSDAASVLLALNRLWKLCLPRAELLRLAMGLGADVPLFVAGENTVARGIGEVLTPVSLPHCFVTLAFPAGRGADRRHLPGAGIDTLDRVGENRRLFRGLWPE